MPFSSLARPHFAQPDVRLSFWCQHAGHVHCSSRPLSQRWRGSAAAPPSLPVLSTSSRRAGAH
eukprot:CAMPEP_0179324038 /NCGR_PEP_ID=MMETSP0797-20121207/60058_1 /TAXON_ID=47934 /ORGANISM="Dinophysis acuminata, Strain DAEP01" /LENGTH=62 /DNA_ID=CAMNT_0021035955 /DNA_START=68 /DNA_END=253 /DNA_ORIENTATION=-